MLTILLLAATLDVESICEKYGNGYTPPPLAQKAFKESKCEEGNLFCNVSLAEGFANAKGAKRDYAIAEYFLCKAKDDIAPMELEGMMEHLQKMRSGAEKKPLSFCDYVTSGYGTTYCANVAWVEAMPLLDARIEAQRTRSTAKPQFDTLVKRAAAFVKADTEQIGMTYKGGTAQSAMTLDAEVASRTKFVENLERFSKQRATAASAEDAKRADDALNSAYRAQQQLLKDDFGDDAAEQQTYLRNAQRAWIPYRDAFADYYVERWRGTAAPDALRREIVTELSKQRAQAIRE
jgi:uncharacterized protein YecT (DUF1311 family)